MSVWTLRDKLDWRDVKLLAPGARRERVWSALQEEDAIEPFELQERPDSAIEALPRNHIFVSAHVYDGVMVASVPEARVPEALLPGALGEPPDGIRSLEDALCCMRFLAPFALPGADRFRDAWLGELSRWVPHESELPTTEEFAPLVSAFTDCLIPCGMSPPASLTDVHIVRVAVLAHEY